MINYTLMFTIAIIVALILYLQIQKLTKKLDQNEENTDLSKYENFCEAIDMQLLNLKYQAGSENFLKDEKLKDEFLKELAILNKQLVFIQNMNSNNKDSKIWEEKLFNFLNQIEDVVKKYVQNAEKTNDNIRENLQKEFQKLI